MLLEKFPIPQKAEKIPSAFAIAFVVITVLSYVKGQSQVALLLMIVSIFCVVAVYVIKAKKRKEWAEFLQNENAKLRTIVNAESLEQYIGKQEELLASLRNPDLKTIVKMNLISGYLANVQGDKALNQIWTMDPATMQSPMHRLNYYSQSMLGYIYVDDAEMVDATYDMAVKTLEEVSEYATMGFVSYEIQYRLFKKEYQLALDQIKELDSFDVDDNNKDIIRAMKAKALAGLGKTEEANNTKSKIENKDLLPSTRWFIKDI